MAQLGFPLLCGAGARAPFDFLSDFLRGIKGSSLDMYRIPEKILQTIDLLTPVCYEAGMNTAKRSGNPRVLLTLHRGAGGFMSEAQFKKFYWPSLKKVLLALVDAGLTPMPFFEGDYTPRLDYLAELPRGRVLGHFDYVDRKKAKKIIGDTMCFWGNVPANTLIIGTPDQVRDNVKELIDIFADNGGLIIDASVGIPDDAKPENVEAMVDTVFKYGVS
jgi:uroporphyrinogen-III decarboxylase